MSADRSRPFCHSERRDCFATRSVPQSKDPYHAGTVQCLRACVVSEEYPPTLLGTNGVEGSPRLGSGRAPLRITILILG